MYSEIFDGSRKEFGVEEEKGWEREEEELMGVKERPYDFCGWVKANGGQTKKVMDFKTGTTTLAFITKDGIVIAVDSRATMGSYISSQKVRKVIEISGQKLATIAGGAADCQYWEAWLAQQVRMFELKHGKEPSVAATSRIMVNLINNYKRYGLSMGLMLAGCDDGCPSLYYIDTEGSRLQGNIFCVGSGMAYAYGVLDAEYHHEMPLPQAIELAKKAIYHATNKDVSSGGLVRVFHVHAGGWTEKVAGEDVNVLHYQYQLQKGIEEDKVKGKI